MIRRSHFLLAALALSLAGCPQTPATRAPLTRPEANLPAWQIPLFRFAAYGDTRDHHDIHRDIVKGVMSFQPALVLQTGDLVHHGDDAAEWRIFDEITGEMRRTIPYYPARGNHDAGRRGFYEQRTPSGKHFYSFDNSGNVHFVAIDTEDDLAPGGEQRTWLEKDLAQAQDARRIIIPFFHKAIFSIGPHARQADVLALRPILHSLFRKHGVRLVFQGHDHLYYRRLQDGIAYIVTGGGGAPLYKGDSTLRIAGDLYERVNHFCIADVYPDRIEVTAYRRNLTRLDHLTVPLQSR